MAYEPISGIVPQLSRNAAGAAANGYYLKGYEGGTTTPLSMGVDSTPSSTLAKCALNSRGEPISNPADETTVFIPHFDETYKLVLYSTETDADNDTTGSAVWIVDNISGIFDASQINYRTGTTVGQFLDNLHIDSYVNLRAVTSSQLQDGDVITITNDGIAGDFVLRNSAAHGLTDNGGTIIVISADWYAERSEIAAYNTRWFEDGGADNAVHLQSAITAASTGTVNQVVIPAMNFSWRSEVTGASGVTVHNYAHILIDADIPAASNNGAFYANTLDKFKFINIGGDIDVTYSGYDNNIFRVVSCTNSKFIGWDIEDDPTDRYPLGPFRTNGNSNCVFRDIDIITVGGIGMQTFEDDDCVFKGIRAHSATSTKTLLETNDGLRNLYTECYQYNPNNTTVSAFSFNDKKSIATANISYGGAYSITVGHAAPYEADGSIVALNIGENADKIGVNVQASTEAVIALNSMSAVQWTTDLTFGDIIRSSSGAARNLYLGNMGNGAQHGLRISSDSLAIGNYMYETDWPIRPSLNSTSSLYLGNVLGNADGYAGFEFNFAGSEGNGVIGNYTFDDRGTPLMTYGYDVKDGSMLLGNMTRGALTAPYNNDGERILNWDADATGQTRTNITLGTGTSTVVNNDLITSNSKITLMAVDSGAASRELFLSAQGAGTITIGHLAGGASDDVQVQIETM